MSYRFELRLAALRKTLGITQSELFRIAGKSYRKMNHVQFIRLNELLEDRLDAIPDLEEMPGFGQIKELLERQVSLLIKDYHRPRDWLIHYLGMNTDWQPYASIITAAAKSGISEEDLQAGAARVKLKRKLVNGQRCWKLSDEE